MVRLRSFAAVNAGNQEPTDNETRETAEALESRIIGAYEDALVHVKHKRSNDAEVRWGTDRRYFCPGTLISAGCYRWRWGGRTEATVIIKTVARAVWCSLVLMCEHAHLVEEC